MEEEGPQNPDIPENSSNVDKPMMFFSWFSHFFFKTAYWFLLLPQRRLQQHSALAAISKPLVPSEGHW